MTLQSYYDTFKFDVEFNIIYKLLKIYKVKFVRFIRVSFLAEKMECALKINNSQIKYRIKKTKLVLLWDVAVYIGGLLFMITFFLREGREVFFKKFS